MSIDYIVKKPSHLTEGPADCIICPVFANNSDKKSSTVKKSSQLNIFNELDNKSNKYLSHIIKSENMDGQFGKIITLHNIPNFAKNIRIVLIGCGEKNKLTLANFKNINSNLIQYLNKNIKTKDFINYLTDCHVQHQDNFENIKQIVINTENNLYKFDQFKSKNNKAEKSNLSCMTIPVDSVHDLSKADLALEQALSINYGMSIMKNLANTPANVCTPDYLAKYAKKLAGEYRKLSVNILDKKQMQKLKMGSLLSVAQGSAQEPKLICLEYKGGKSGEAPIVLVGKGITFDTGGNSIKPAGSMIGMKYDMSGGACVIGTIAAAAELNLPVNIVTVVAAAENMVGSRASRPDDIVTTMSGKTVEILNTDAEGRLVLCDALTYCRKFKPEYIIDVATLTGACIVALGGHNSGLYTNYQPLANKLLSSGKKIGDKCWQMPLDQEYRQQLNSNFADLANIGGPDAGSITAAAFLADFTKNLHWAHLDVAGTATDRVFSKGKVSSSGRPVTLLMQFLIDCCNS